MFKASEANDFSSFYAQFKRCNPKVLTITRVSSIRFNELSGFSLKSAKDLFFGVASYVMYA